MSEVLNCGACAALLPAAALACPSCQALVHAVDLNKIATEARAQESQGNIANAKELWQEALGLLPPESAQAGTIRDHLATLGASQRTQEHEKPQPEWIKKLGPLGIVFAFLLKFKGLALVALTKAKFLLLGLGKLKTLLSMLATVGVYWTMFGWKFALGFVLGIYVHEMGHVWMLHKYGLRASSPMFIPGFGAFVSLYDSPANESQDARIGLAGPMWGAAAAISCLIFQFTGASDIWIAIARATATINLFNLIPIWSLDGGRGFRALDRIQRIYVAVALLALWWITGVGMFFLILLGAGYRICFAKDFPKEGDQGVLFQFLALLAVFGFILAMFNVRGIY